MPVERWIGGGANVDEIGDTAIADDAWRRE